MNALARALKGRLQSRSATVAVVGLGYVGLPLAVAFARAGFAVIGVDADRRRVEQLARGDNELAVMCRHLGLSVWGIVAAAATKPRGSGLAIRHVAPAPPLSGSPDGGVACA
ncbi:MAG: hypothetical protein HYV93_24465 [Candidatus Rokubacteria bacterium]|nr:hypothetical protein [Candidatus Rokubacteria bacterium]